MKVLTGTTSCPSLANVIKKDAYTVQTDTKSVHITILVLIFFFKSHIRETLNLSTCADSTTDTDNYFCLIMYTIVIYEFLCPARDIHFTTLNCAKRIFFNALIMYTLLHIAL